MSKIIDFPRDSRVHEQAALWIARLDRSLSSSEQQELHEWVHADTRHRAALFEMAALWDRMAVLDELSELFPLHPGFAATRRLHWSAAAALLLFAVVVGVWFAWREPNVATISAQSQLSMNALYETRRGEQRVITLPDRSVVTLNTHSQLQVAYDTKDRQLILRQGEAHFSVAKGDPRVFTVRAGDTEFKAVGTAFNIRLNAQRKVALTVNEGRVKVLVARATRTATGGVADTEIMVDAGREVIIDNAIQTVANLPPAKLQAALAWTQGMMAFDGQPLEQALREVSRYADVQWVLADESLAQLPVSGYFKVGDVDGLLAALHASLDIEAEHRDGKIILSAQP